MNIVPIYSDLCYIDGTIVHKYCEMKNDMDPTDVKIIRQLENDGRISFATLGEVVGLSKTPCWSRVKDLESQGVIEGYGARVSAEALGLSIRALVHAVVSFDHYEEFERAIVSHRSVRSCLAVTGEYDYVLEILAADMAAIDLLLRNDISRLPGVTRFNTSITTRMIKSAGRYSDML